MSSVLQELIDENEDGHHLEINHEGGVCYAIAVIDEEYDEVAVYEEGDLTQPVIDAANQFCAGHEDGAISWPTTPEN